MIDALEARIRDLTDRVTKFTVAGDPKPQGSMRAFNHAKTGKVIVRHGSPELAPWRTLVALEARHARDDRPLIDAPVGVTLTFTLRRPKSAPKRRTRPDRKPDLDKLVRGVLDALEGVVWTNDSRVCIVHASKAYGDPPGLEVVVVELD